MRMGTGSVKIYIDSNVFLNYWFDEYSNKPCAHYAERLFTDAIKCKYDIIISTLVLEELETKSHLTEEEIVGEWFKEFRERQKIDILKIKGDVLQKAQWISEKYGIHRADAVHAAFSFYFCDYLVTNDKGFDKIKDILNVVTPEDLLLGPT